MVSQDKPLPAEVLKETYVLLEDASVLYYAAKLYGQYGEDCPDRLVEMFEERLDTVKSNLDDLAYPIPF